MFALDAVSIEESRATAIWPGFEFSCFCKDHRLYFCRSSAQRHQNVGILNQWDEGMCKKKPLFPCCAHFNQNLGSGSWVSGVLLRKCNNWNISTWKKLLLCYVAHPRDNSAIPGWIADAHSLLRGNPCPACPAVAGAWCLAPSAGPRGASWSSVNVMHSVKEDQDTSVWH